MSSVLFTINSLPPLLLLSIFIVLVPPPAKENSPFIFEESFKFIIISPNCFSGSVFLSLLESDFISPLIVPVFVKVDVYPWPEDKSIAQLYSGCPSLVIIPELVKDVLP